MNIYDKLKVAWKSIGIKGQIKNYSSKVIWVLETDSGPPIAHKLLPMTKSPASTDADAFRRVDGVAVEGHRSWWKTYDFSTAEIFDAGKNIRLSVFSKAKVDDQEFGATQIIYNNAGDWGQPIKLITDVKRNKKKIITAYYVSEIGWVSPMKALTLTCYGEIDNARPVFPDDREPYIRTRRDKELFNNIEVKG